MRIGTINQKQNNPSFKSWMTNKAVLKGLETISEHGTSFIAATTFLMATGVRPLVISATPNVEKENKQYASTNSIASGIIKFAMVEAVAIPIENAIKKIDKDPKQFLKPETIKNLATSAEDLVGSRSYKFATQLLKLGTGFVTAIPKSMLTIALIPVLMEKFFNKKNESQPQKQLTQNVLNHNPSPVFAQMYKKPSFKGLSNTVAKGIGLVIDNKSFQNFVKKNQFNDTNIARNISMATDLLLTASFIHRTKKNNKIKKERKNPLIYNNIISTGISLTAGFAIDKFIQNNTKEFIKKFSEANINNPKLPKYIEGINIVRPTLIFAAIYYGILPMVSTYISDKIDKITTQKSN